MATILIVDDRPVNRQFLVTLLRYKGHRLLEASDGAEGLAVAKAEPPELIITDVLMPRMDGYEFVRQLRAEPALASTPIIFYTAHYGEPEAQALAQTCGVRHILPKWSEPEVVLQMVETALGVALPPVSPPPAEAFDREHLRLLTNKLSDKVDELKLVNERLAELVDLNLQLASERDPHRLLERFCHAARDRIGAKVATVSVLREGERSLRHFFTSGLAAKNAAGLDFPLPRFDILAPLLAERRSFRLHNPGGDPETIGFPAAYPPIHALLAVPILSSSRVYGWLCLIDKVEAEVFSAEDEQLATLLATLTGQIYENGRLYAEVQRRAGELEQEVAERKRTEDELRRSAAELRFVNDLVEQTTQPIAVSNLEGGLVRFNHAYEQLTGYSGEELLQMAYQQLTPVHWHDLNMQQLAQLRDTGQAVRFEKVYRRKDGTLVPVEVVVDIYRNAAGEPKYEYAFVTDITERKCAETELAQHAAQLALINDIGSKIAAMLELDGVLDRAAHLVQESFGYHHVALFLVEGEVARLKAVAGSYRVYFSPDHSQKLNEGIIGWVGRHGEKVVANDVSAEPRYISLIAEQTVTQAELCLPIKAADQLVGILDIQSPHLNAFSENDVIAMETLTHQIAVAIENARLYQAAQEELAERKQAEAETRRRNRELTLLNQVIAASVAGLEPEAVLNIACYELALAFEAPLAMASLLNDKKTVAAVVAEYLSASSSPGQSEAGSMLDQTVHVAASAAFQYLLIHKTPLAIADARTDPRLPWGRDLILRRGTISLLLLPLLIKGEVVGSLTVETTEPRHFSLEEISLAWSVAEQVGGVLARARMTQTQQRLSAAIEQAAESVIITTTKEAIIYVNPAFERVSGYSRAEAIGQSMRLVKSGQHEAAFYQELWATLEAGQVWHGRFVNKKKDGTLYTEDATITRVRDESGGLINYVSVQRDVTRELQLEEQYRQAQKMEAIGRLSGGVAHDFNNLLVVITGYSELLLDRHLTAASPLRRYIEEIKKAGERAAGLTGQLLAFSRQQVLQPEILELNGVVVNTEQMLRRLIGEDIDLIVRLEPELGQVKADAGQIEQIILNLAVNARDAMPRGGKLTIETANVELDETYARQHVGVKPGSYVMLAMSDSGSGMDAATQARIFEPFFTTKEPGKGTGLGLATVYGIVKQSDGDIWVYSEPEHGTTFKIYLPRVQETTPAVEAQPSLPDMPVGTETILLVEDEEAVRLLTCQVLEMSGYIVLEAGHGGEALLLCEQRQEPIHLLVTDVIMPHMGGQELAERLVSLYPAMKILYISGYTDDAIVRHGVLEPGLFFLQKPFTPNALAQKVREVLDRRPQN